MVAYQDFVALCRSGDSEERGQAAHLAAMAFLDHTGPADEHAALYAALVGFLDDPSVKVRAALAYGLLHAPEAPRPILLALLQDSAVIARAVAQYSPALIDADLVGLAHLGDLPMLLVLAERRQMGARLLEALVRRGERTVTLKLLARPDLVFPAALLDRLARTYGDGDPGFRGALLRRRDLPSEVRLRLVEAAAAALKGTRIVHGAVQPARLDRLLRHATDAAISSIGEAAAGDGRFAGEMVSSSRVSARLMLHAIVNGQVLFFADCVAELAEMPRHKVFALLESGGRPALNALLARSGLPPAVRNMVVRLILHARAADLADDLAARHFVVTALTEELIVEHDGVIPAELEEAFTYLSEQNVALARLAARGVMAAFAEDGGRRMPPAPWEVEPLALPAA